MPPSKPVEVTINGIPAGQFAYLIWHREGKYLLRLKRIELSYQRTLTAVTHYSYFLGIEKHAGYALVTLNLYGRSWLINIAKRNFYVQSIHPETE